MATKLDIFNTALHYLGERKLSTLYEDREPRYVLENLYSINLIQEIHEVVKPRYALKTAQLSSPTTSSVHGLDNVYTLPSDFLCPPVDPGTHGKVGFIWADDEFTQPVNRYFLESGTVATEIATNVYIRYVSNSVSEGSLSSLVARIVATRLAMLAASRINPSKQGDLNEQYNQLIQQAVAIEGLKENDFLPQPATGALSADQLEIYNLVMAHWGLPELRGVSDDSQYRLAIDNVYVRAEEYMLESIKPMFATQTAELTSPSASAVHGLDNVFSLPADYIEFVDLWADDKLENQINQYIIEDNTIATQNYATAYLRYITNAHTEANWSPSFTNAVAAYIAWLLSPRYAPQRQDSIEKTLSEATLTAVENNKLRERQVRTQDISGALSADQLVIYNLVAGYVGQPELRFVNDESELRLAIDNVYDTARNFIFESVKPKFATQTAILSGGGTSAVHGLDNVFTLPSDYLDFVDLWADDKLENQIHQYILEDDTVAIQNYSTAYLRYVTDAHVEANWSTSVKHAIAAYISWMLAPRFAPEATDKIREVMSETLASAVEHDGVREREVRTQDISGSLSASQLSLYNQIAARLGQPELRFVDDESELRLAIDNVYGLARDYLIEQIQPLFATKTAILNSPAASAVHGFDNVFTFPNDYSGLLGVWTDEDMDERVHRYFIEEGTIAVDNHAAIYIRYSANAADEADWTPSFNRAMAEYIAWILSPRFTPDATNGLRTIYQEAMQAAVNVDRGREPDARPVPSTRALTDDLRSLYNKALELMKLPPLLSNDDESERRVAIDYALDNGAIETVFDLINWSYNVKQAKLEDDGVYAPTFGYTYRFAVPADMTRLYSISSDDRFLVPLERWYREGAYFYADVDEFYIKYLSTAQHTTTTDWPRYMFNLVAAEIARACCWLQGVDEQTVERKYQEYKYEAYNTDAQRQPPQVISSGSWTKARYSYETRNRRRP